LKQAWIPNKVYNEKTKWFEEKNDQKIRIDKCTRQITLQCVEMLSKKEEKLQRQKEASKEIQIKVVITKLNCLYYC
jgi:hypothetical protein